MTGRTTSFCTVTSPDKAKQKYFLFPNHLIIIVSEIKLCAESRKHFLSSQTLISWIIIIQHYINFPYLKLPPNQTCLVSLLAWLCCCSAQTSLELGRQTRIPQTTAWAWSLWVWHTTVAWPVIWVWCDVWPVTRACIWPHQWPPLDINIWIMPDDKM